MTNDTNSLYFHILTKLSDGGYSIGVGFEGNKPHFVQSTYSKAWIDTYVDRSFLLDDPTIIHGQKMQGHFTWSELQDLYPDNPVLPAARNYGLVEGNTLSLRIDGICTILSASGPKWSPEELRHAKAAASGLHHLEAPEPMPCLLKPGELEVVVLMAAGLKDQEIADSLNMKIETVRKRRRCAYEKTGAQTSAALVSVAITNDWF